MHQSRSIPTNEFVKNRLKELFAKGISPSALNTFNRCPMDFYYKYVIGLSELEEVDENIDRAVFGQIVHKVLENFYSGFIGSFPASSDLKKLIADSRSKVEESLDSPGFRNYTWSGENALALDIAADMVARFAEAELRESTDNPSAKRIITGIEVDIEWTLESAELDWPGGVKIRGKADRIEKYDGQTRILDYKTGAVDASNLKEPRDGDVFGNNGKSKLLQLYLYQYAYCRMNKLSPGAVVPGIYSMRNHRQGILWLDNDSIEKLGEAAWFQRIERGLLDSVKRIFETEHFSHNSKSEFCSYCNA
jgi:RecB family exonuclease